MRILPLRVMTRVSDTLQKCRKGRGWRERNSWRGKKLRNAIQTRHTISHPLVSIVGVAHYYAKLVVQQLSAMSCQKRVGDGPNGSIGIAREITIIWFSPRGKKCPNVVCKEIFEWSSKSTCAEYCGKKRANSGRVEINPGYSVERLREAVGVLSLKESRAGVRDTPSKEPVTSCLTRSLVRDTRLLRVIFPSGFSFISVSLSLCLCFSVNVVIWAGAVRFYENRYRD